MFGSADGGEVIAKRKGVAVRRGLKEAWSKRASRYTKPDQTHPVPGERANDREAHIPMALVVNAAVAERGRTYPGRSAVCPGNGTEGASDYRTSAGVTLSDQTRSRMAKILEQLVNQRAAMMEFRMKNGNHGARLLAYVTGLVNQELLF
jgi:hypothetical protein